MLKHTNTGTGSRKRLVGGQVDRVEGEVIVNSDRSRGRKEEVTAKDLWTIMPNTWVNDVVVNFYLRELVISGSSLSRSTATATSPSARSCGGV